MKQSSIKTQSRWHSMAWAFILGTDERHVLVRLIQREGKGHRSPGYLVDAVGTKKQNVSSMFRPDMTRSGLCRCVDAYVKLQNIGSTHENRLQVQYYGCRILIVGCQPSHCTLQRASCTSSGRSSHGESMVFRMLIVTVIRDREKWSELTNTPSNQKKHPSIRLLGPSILSSPIRDQTNETAERRDEHEARNHMSKVNNGVLPGRCTR